MRERDVIKRLRDAFKDYGIGDDAAVLASPEGELLFASDAVVEGVHFKRGCGTLGQAVQKVITSNVSDIYAMGGAPYAAVMTAGLPAGCGETEIDSIIMGAASACDVYGVKLAGGDTVRSPGGYFFDVAITGSVERGRAVRRTGARPGDAVVLFGACGGALAGFIILNVLYDDVNRSLSRNESITPGGAQLSDAAAFIERLMPMDSGVRDRVKKIIPALSLAMAAEDIEHLCDGHGLGREAAPLLQLAARHLVPRARPLDRTLLGARSISAGAQSEDPSRADRSISAGAQSMEPSLPAEHPRAAGTPRVAAMIDVSDGLARDLRALCAESGVGASIEEALLPVHPVLGHIIGPRDSGEVQSSEQTIGAGGARDAQSTGTPASIARKSSVELILSSGEEYVLLAAVRGLAEGSVPPGGTVIGRIVERRRGFTIVTRDGESRPLPELGYEHLF